MTIAEIQKPLGSLEIVEHLLRNEKATITNLISDAGLNRGTAYSALARLGELKLVTQWVCHSFPASKYYQLTGKGKVVARHLDRINDVMTRE